MGFGPLRLGIVALVLATALIHTALAVPEELVPFYLNALGYLALLAALAWPRLRAHERLIRRVLLGYCALTVILWAAFGQPYTPIGYLDKLIEVVLIALLWVEDRRSAA